MQSRFISNDVLIEILEQATQDEKMALTKILNSYQKKPFTPQKIQEELSLAGGNSFMNFFRGEGTGYIDIVDDLLEQLEIEGMPSYMLEVCHFDKKDTLQFNENKARLKGIDYVEKAEEKIILKLLEKAYNEMTDEQKESFDEEMNKVALLYDSNITTKVSGAAGLLILGNLGGFATYTLLTSSMSIISMGALGFGAYTAATTFLSIILGPVGWAGLSAYAFYSIGKGNYKKLIPSVAIIGAIRQRIKYETLVSTKN